MVPKVIILTIEDVDSKNPNWEDLVDKVIHVVESEGLEVVAELTDSERGDENG